MLVVQSCYVTADYMTRNNSQWQRRLNYVIDMRNTIDRLRSTLRHLCCIILLCNRIICNTKLKPNLK